MAESSSSMLPLIVGALLVRPKRGSLNPDNWIRGIIQAADILFDQGVRGFKACAIACGRPRRKRGACDISGQIPFRRSDGWGYPRETSPAAEYSPNAVARS